MMKTLAEIVAEAVEIEAAHAALLAAPLPATAQGLAGERDRWAEIDDRSYGVVSDLANLKEGKKG